MNRANFIATCNQYASQGQAFLFLADFTGEEFEIFRPSEIQRLGIEVAFPNFSTSLSSTDPRSEQGSPEIGLLNQITFSDYQKAYLQIQEAIQRGDSYLCNLTFAQEIQLQSSLQDLFQIANARFKILFPNKFLCFSPEIFIEIKDQYIHTYPMKGTFYQQERSDFETEKEQAEHATVVDLLRNDLSLVASEVAVIKYRYLEKILSHNGKEFLQSSSHLQGKLENNWKDQLGSIICRLLPAGSVTGAPKNKTLELIKNTENYQRHYYTGIAGFFDGHSLSSCVLIRFIEKIGERYFFKTGGGVTSLSNPDREYNELINKIYVPISRKYPS